MNKVYYIVMGPIEAYLDRTTTYRLVRTWLLVLAVASVPLAALGYLPYTPVALIASLAILLFVTRAVNSACALFTGATPTPESAYITGLMLFFVLAPLQSAVGAFALIVAAAVAILSKYVFAFGKKHIFNPAAVALLVLSLSGSGIVVWWVGTPILLPFVIGIGFLILRKVRRFDVFGIYMLAAVGVSLVVPMARAGFAGAPLLAPALTLLTASPLLFVGALMLADPQTMPASKTHRRIYALIVGLLFAVPFSFGTLSVMPAIALLVGNLYAYAVGMRRRISLTLHKVTQLSREVYEYAFIPNNSVKFKSGQYLEWTLPHPKADNRGIRRFFSIASAPSDPFVRIAVHIPATESSTFKDALRALKKGDRISAVTLAGEPILPRDPDQKIVAVACGVGVAPLMSMFRQLATDRRRRDIVLIYSTPTPLDLAYKDELDSIKDSIGLRVLYLPIDFTELTDWSGASGHVTAALIQKEIPDFASRHWHIAGPTISADLNTYVARSLGVPKRAIKTQFFPGF
jgi:ferredoxin-NADP reductase/Na+-transporting NADH:ubiquinone oxidoreductase subunit NqrB